MGLWVPDTINNGVAGPWPTANIFKSNSDVTWSMSVCRSSVHCSKLLRYPLFSKWMFLKSIWYAFVGSVKIWCYVIWFSWFESGFWFECFIFVLRFRIVFMLTPHLSLLLASSGSLFSLAVLFKTFFNSSLCLIYVCFICALC